MHFYYIFVNYLYNRYINKKFNLQQNSHNFEFYLFLISEILICILVRLENINIAFFLILNKSDDRFKYL